MRKMLAQLHLFDVYDFFFIREGCDAGCWFLCFCDVGELVSVIDEQSRERRAFRECVLV